MNVKIEPTSFHFEERFPWREAITVWLGFVSFGTLLGIAFVAVLSGH